MGREGEEEKVSFWFAVWKDNGIRFERRQEEDVAQDVAEVVCLHM